MQSQCTKLRHETAESERNLRAAQRRHARLSATQCRNKTAESERNLSAHSAGTPSSVQLSAGMTAEALVRPSCLDTSWPSYLTTSWFSRKDLSGQNFIHTVYIVYTRFSAGKSPNKWYTRCKYIWQTLEKTFTPSFSTTQACTFA